MSRGHSYELTAGVQVLCFMISCIAFAAPIVFDSGIAAPIVFDSGIVAFCRRVDSR